MPQISDQQIANCAKAGGWTTDAEIAIAVAVALAESGGNSEATHVNKNGSTDYGLWQVNSIHGFPVGDLLNGPGNAIFAHRVYLSQGWKAWTTYKSGAYLAYLARGRAVAPNASASGAVTDPETHREIDIPGVSEFIDFIKFITSGHNWARIGFFVLGGMLLLIGLMQMTGHKPSEVGKTVAKAVVLKKMGGGK